MHARTVQEDRARYQRGCTQSCPFTKGHAGVRAIEQCTQKSRDAFCTPEGPARLRAYALTRSHRRTRRVSPRRHCAEPQDDGAASTRPANKRSVCVDCVRGLAGRLWCSPIRLQRPTWNKPKRLPIANPITARLFSTASTPMRNSDKRRTACALPFKRVPLNEPADLSIAIVIRCVGTIVRKRRSRDSHPLIANKGDSHEVHQYLDCTSRHFQRSSRTFRRNRWRTTPGRQNVGTLAWHER